MYEYQFINVASDWSDKYHLYEHREEIQDQASQGWRFVAYIPTRLTGNGLTMEADLVFERSLR